MAEQIAGTLDVALTHAGHGSLLLAPRGSKAAGVLLDAPAPSDPDRARAQWRALLADVLSRYYVDVVHLHGIDAADYLPWCEAPIVVTLHHASRAYPRALFAPRPDLHLICVSRAQQREIGRAVPVVPHGIAVQLFAPRLHKDDFALVLGRLVPEKGVHVAMDAACRAGVRLLIGGPLSPRPLHVEWFDQELAPRLGPRTRYLGPLGFADKSRLLAHARCLIVTSLMEEASSLAAMEALACGTPIAGLRNRGLAEIVDDGVTGRLVDAPEDLPEAIAEASALDPRACRRAALERFDAADMAERYLEIYRALTA